MGKINETIINCAIYEDSITYYGLAEVQLPEISNLTEEVKGAGVAGSYESVVLGHIEAMSLTMNFRTPTTDMYQLFEPRAHQLDLRVVAQNTDSKNHEIGTTAIKHVVVVKPKKMAPGKVAPASGAEANVELAVMYWATYIDGNRVQEIDPLNFKYEINGVDYLADVRKALGK